MELLADIISLSLSEILSDELFEELLSIESQVEQTRNELELIDKAKNLGVKLKFETMLKAFKSAKRKFDKETKTKIVELITENPEWFVDFYLTNLIQ